MNRTLLLATTLAAAVAGCSDPLDTEAPTSARAHAVDFVAYGTNDAFAAIETDAERRRIHEQNVELFDQIEPASGLSYTWFFRSERPLAEKDAVAASLLDEHPGVEWIFARQKIAVPLLELHLRAGSEDVAAIERYARVLIETGNPSADLLSEALPLLGDRIDAEERDAALASTQAAARTWLSQVQCDGCTAEALQVDSEEGGLPRKVRALQDALGPLQD